MRNVPRTRIEPRASRGPGAPRALVLGVGLFVFTLVVVGLLLFASGSGGGSGSGDNTSNNAVVGAASPAATPSPPSRSAIATGAPSTPTATTAVAPSATVTDAAPTETATDSPTDTPTEGDMAEATATTENTDEPTATAPATSTDAASETPTSDVGPTQPPAVGEFGNLPPAEIPSGGLARDLNLQYQLGVSLDGAPGDASVYKLQWPDRTKTDVAALAQSIGVSGEVVDQGNGSFQVSGGSGNLVVAPNVVQIVVPGQAPAGALEDDSTLVNNARSWLLDRALVGADIGDGSVASRDPNGKQATVVFSTAEVSPLLAAYPSARVTLGPGGTVFEAYVKWPANYQVADYTLRSTDELWNDVQAGQGYLEADLSGVPGDGPLSGNLTVTSVSLAYSTAESSDGSAYLVPIMVFSGEASVGDTGTTVPVSVYVPAIAGQPAPRG